MKTKKGFTLVELVVVIAVIAILAGVMISTMTSVIGRANQSSELQKWKTRVDEAFFEYSNEKLMVPKFVKLNTAGDDLEFADKNDESSSYAEINKTLAVQLDKDHDIYLVFSGADDNYSYAVVTGTKVVGNETEIKIDNNTYTKDDNLSFKWTKTTT